VQVSSATPVDAATLVVANVPTCDLHSPKTRSHPVLVLLLHDDCCTGWPCCDLELCHRCASSSGPLTLHLMELFWHVIVFKQQGSWVNPRNLSAAHNSNVVSV
jgi:hypothetical protein